MKEMLESVTAFDSSKEEEEKAWNLKEGMEVQIKTSDGFIDAGWVVSGLAGSQTLVSKENPSDPDNKITMITSSEVLRMVNQPGKIDFSQADNMRDLQILLLTNGNVKGSSREYTPKEIMAIIQDIEENDKPFELLPRANNLRETVQGIVLGRESADK